jgi:UDP-GlcNAc:undecaprenyl-phosphate GlcNAc-1-phosphate transferase
LNNPYITLYATYFLFCTLFSFLINRLFLKFSSTLGTKNSGGEIIRWSNTSKPAIGGISFYILFLASVASYAVFFTPEETGANYSVKFVGLLLSMALGFLVGLADDAYNTQPFLKFSIQFVCAVVLIYSGIFIRVFESNVLNYALTLIWVVGIMNSINMLDNMDGITTMVSFFILLIIILIMFFEHDYNNIHLLVLVGVLASLTGFLYFNWNPSKMYMGDTGSQFLGVFLSSMGIMYFWNDYYAPNAAVTLSKQFIIPLIAFIVPIIDTTVVVVNRVSRGQSPFVGGRDHTTHSLAYIGLSDRQVAYIFAGISANSVFMILYIKRYIIEWSWEFTLLFGSYFLLLLAVFFYFSFRARQQSKLK